MKNINKQPQLRKKNGIWIKVLVPTLCIIAGAGAMAGLCRGIPSVGSAIIGTDISQPNPGINSDTSDTTNLKNQINDLTSQLNDATALLYEKDQMIEQVRSQLQSKDQSISELQSRLDSLQSLETTTEEQRQQIEDLTNQLDSLTNDRNNLSSQLESAMKDKQSAESIVLDLQQQINELQAKVDKYEGNAVVDTLKLENFEGTWYKNGTFEDYYTIKDGAVTKGANLDNGSLLLMSGQMYFVFNSGTNMPVTLDTNGLQFTTASGDVYTSSYINTITDTQNNMAVICGQYVYNDERIELSSDNTVKFSQNGQIKYGTYTSTAKQKNVGGNIKCIYYITANIIDDNNTISFTLTDNMLIGNQKSYQKVNYDPSLATTENTYEALNGSAQFYLIFKVTKGADIVKSNGVGSSRLYVESNGYLGYQANSSYSYNDYNKQISGIESLYLQYGTKSCNSDVEYIKIGLKFYKTIKDNEKAYLEILNPLLDLTKYDSSSKSYIKYGEAQLCGIDASESVMNKLMLGTAIASACNFESSFYKNCESITSYVNGSYSMDSTTINIADNTATVNDITADSVNITAKTDGTNIVQTVTIKYTTEETEHTITFDIVNNAKSINNAKLDNVDTTITKD